MEHECRGLAPNTTTMLDIHATKSTLPSSYDERPMVNLTAPRYSPGVVSSFAVVNMWMWKATQGLFRAQPTIPEPYYPVLVLAVIGNMQTGWRWLPHGVDDDFDDMFVGLEDNEGTLVPECGSRCNSNVRCG